MGWWPPLNAFQSFFKWTLLEFQSKDTVIIPIEVLVHNANRKACPECQSKGSFRTPIEESFRMPIEMYLKHHSKNFLFLRQEFVINHARGRLWETSEGKFWGTTMGNPTHLAMVSVLYSYLQKDFILPSLPDFASTVPTTWQNTKHASSISKLI